MGKSFTPKYAVVIHDSAKGRVEMSWDGKRHGRANAANLQKFVEAYGASLKPGGVNAHLGEAFPQRAIIRVNAPAGAVIAEWKAPMFMIW
jgi:hypothetical protein